jgi:PAS domain S-box-containing protein
MEIRQLAHRSMQDLAGDRDRFLATGEVAGGVRPVVRESWRRSAAYGVSPSELRPQQVSTEDVDVARSRSAALLDAATPFITTMHETLLGHPHVVAVSDAEGRILRLLADAGADEDALPADFTFEGASWHERSIGSNGIGTALATGEPVILIGPEHFQEACTGWTGIGVPLHDARGGIVGSLALCVPNRHVNVHAWGWTLAVGRSIEARLGGGFDDDDAAFPPTAAAPFDDPFNAIRGVLDLLAQQLDLAPTHARFIEQARREVEEAAARLNGTLRELTEREERLRLVLDNSPDATFVQDHELRYVWGTRTGGSFSADEYIGRTDAELFDDAEDVRILTDIKRRVLREGRRTTVDITVTKDGQRRRLHATLEPARQQDGSVVGLFGYVRDVTAEWKTREALRESHARMRAVLDILPAGVWIADADGRILETNAAAVELWGGHAPHSQSADEYGNDYVAWWPDGTRVASHEWGLARAVRGGEAAGEEVVIRCADGSLRTVLNFARPVRDGSGNIDGAVALAIDISDRKRAEELLRTSEERFRKLAESSTLGVLIGTDAGAMHYANATARRMLGYSEDDVAEGRLRRETIVAPGYAGAHVRAAVELEATGSCTPYETVLLGQDGREVPVLIGASELDLREQEYRSIATFLTDLTALRAAERALSESEARFRTLANSIPQLAWMADPGGTTFWYNDRWYEYTGTRPGDLAGEGWKRVHHPDHVERIEQGLRDARTTGHPWEDTFPIRSRTGEYRWFLARAMPVHDPAGSIVRWIGTNTDITERRHAQAELQRLYEEAQQAVRQREEVVGVVSHDLRNPLSTIAMASALLLDPAVGEEKKVIQAAVIRRAVEQMMHLIQDLLDVSRMTASRLYIDQRQEDPASLVRSAAQLSTNAAESKDIDLKVSAPAGLPAVRADRQRILQVFGNLLTNAIEFTPPGGCVTIGAHAAFNAVVFTVSDTGPGIDPDEQELVFDRFWQGSRHAGRGAGLGLTICKGIVEAHGGTIGVLSEPGHGATFQFSIPAA